ARIAAFKKEREWYGDPDEGGPIFSMNGAGRRLAGAAIVLPAAPGVAVSRLFDGMGLRHAQSVAPAGEWRGSLAVLRVDPDRLGLALRCRGCSTEWGWVMPKAWRRLGRGEAGFCSCASILTG